MKYKKLGRTGLMVSEICLGTMTFGQQAGETEAINIVKSALAAGVNFIDTANAYVNGRSEEIVGKALKNERNSVVLATKAGAWRSGPGVNDFGLSRKHIMTEIEDNLRRLKTDYIDLYYVHRPDPVTPIEETLRTLDDLVHQGKVRYIACSNFLAWQLCEALWTSKVNNLESFVVVQSGYNLLDRTTESELAPCCQAHGVGMIPWGPLAGGFLTGKYERGKSPSSESAFANPRSSYNQVLNEANFDKMDNLRAFAAQHGHNTGELAIAWLLSHSWLSSVIAGATSPEQVSANVAAGAWKLTAEEMAQLG